MSVSRRESNGVKARRAFTRSGIRPRYCRFHLFSGAPPPFLQHCKALFQAIEVGTISAVYSTRVFSELLVPAFRQNEKQRAEKIVRILTHFPHLTAVPLTPTISAAAARLRALHGLRTPDAIHAATALESKAAGLIINDKGFKKITTHQFSVWLFDG